MAQVVEASTLPDTDRGAGGFGSTGISSALAPEVAPAETIASVAKEAEGATIASGSLLVQKLGPTAVLPVRGSEVAAGFDLARYIQHFIIGV